MIDYLGKNQYYLHFDLPNSYILTQPNAVPNDAIDSDVDQSNGSNTTKWYMVLPGTHTPHVDAGIILDAVLPVSWLDVTATDLSSHHVIQWQIENEKNISHYEIESSINSASNFSHLNKVLSNASQESISSYAFENYDIYESGIYYYRIKQIDLDGNSSYSKIVSLDVSPDIKKSNTVSIYPNPVVNDLTIELEIQSNVSDFHMNLFDSQGRLVRKNVIIDFDLKPGIKKYEIDVQTLAKGIYSAQIHLDNKKIVKKLIVVSN